MRPPMLTFSVHGPLNGISLQGMLCPKWLLQKGLVVRAQGIEPWTYGLKVCSSKP